MLGPRNKVLIKIALDAVFVVLVLTVYFVEVFQYMDTYYIGTTVIMNKQRYYQPTTGKKTPLDMVVIASYNDFDSKFCKNEDIETKQVCDNRKAFENAGILFMVFSCLSLSFLAYGLTMLIGMLCGCSCWTFFKMTFTHYVYPIVYAIAVVLYITVSGMFSLDTPTGTSSNSDKMNVELGIITMLAAGFVSILSTIFFILAKNSMKSLVKVSNENYEHIKD
jgi:hypothetical protein